MTLCEDDVLVLVLAGHGELDGVFKIGDEDGNDCELTKGELEESLGNTKATVWLISTACWGTPATELFSTLHHLRQSMETPLLSCDPSI